MVQCLCKNGYTGSAELYYLPPLSEPAIGLVHIAGEEDIKKMMTVHAEQGTRNCHRYIVDGSDDDETAYGYLDGVSTCFCSQHSSEYFAMHLCYYNELAMQGKQGVEIGGSLGSHSDCEQDVSCPAQKKQRRQNSEEGWQ